MTERGRRVAALVATMTLGLALSACSGAGLPASVVKGSAVTVAWSGSLTSLNAASLTGRTPGNLDIAALTRSQFATLVDGSVVPDPAFGTVRIVDQKPFRVRYDLAERTWSDGVPVDAADLLLAWASGADTRAGFQVLPGALAASAGVPSVDEFARAIEVPFASPVRDWQTALEVAVPAHVLGRLAFGTDDPMEAKQAVLDAIRSGDDRDRARLADAWNERFALEEGKAPGASLLVSDGPYRVDSVATDKSGRQHVELVANASYVGADLPKVERLRLLQLSESEGIDRLGSKVDVIQTAAVPAYWETFHALERRDFKVATSHDGTMWVLALRATAPVFARPAARAAFLRAVPRGKLADTAGQWSNAYEATDAFTVPPGGDGYQVVTEDSALADKLTGGDGAAERTAAGVPAGARVCVGFDASDTFAAGAVALLRSGMAEAGWAIADCGHRGFTPTSGTGWDAALVKVPVPSSTLGIGLLWGGAPALNLSGSSNPERDALIAQLGEASDLYKARELRGAVEASIVHDAVGLPLFMNPALTVTSPRVQGVVPRAGAEASLLAGVTGWSVVPPR